MSVSAATLHRHVVCRPASTTRARPSGGNRYDRRVCRGLAAAGWDVREHAVPGTGRRPTPRRRRRWPRWLGELPGRRGGAGRRADRLGRASGAAAGRAAAAAGRAGAHAAGRAATRPHARRSGRCWARPRAVVTTSAWTRELAARRTYAAAAGTRARRPSPASDPAAAVAAAPRTAASCCASPPSTPGKGHDVLLAALARSPTCRGGCVLRRQPRPRPGLVERLRRQAAADGIADRVDFAGPLTGATLDDAYAAADVLVLAVARRDVRHGGHRGAGPRAAGDRHRRRRRAGGAGPAPEASGPGCWSPPGDPVRAGRRAAPAGCSDADLRGAALRRHAARQRCRRWRRPVQLVGSRPA